MRHKPSTTKSTTPKADATVRDIRRATRKHYSSEAKIRIVLEGLIGEESIAALCRREGIAQSLYCCWSKEFLEAGKRRSLVETKMHCIKLLGEGIIAIDFERQVTEIKARAVVLNTFTQLGTPITQRVV